MGKENCEKERPFDFLRKLLIITGVIVFDYGPWKNILTVINIFSQTYLPVVAILGVFEDNPFTEKIQALLVFTCNVPLLSKVIVMSRRRTLINQLMDSLEEMDEESSRHPKFKEKSVRNIFLSKLVAWGCIGSFITLHFAAAVLSIIKHLNGVDSMAFPVYTPFPKYEYFYLTCIYVYVICFLPIVILGMANGLLCSFTLSISMQMSYLINNLENIGLRPSKKDEDTDVNYCIRLHQKILRVTQNLNDLCSDLIYLEYLISSLQCCITGYQLIRAKSNHDPGVLLYFIMFLMSLVVPVLFSACGNTIKHQSEEVYLSVYNNNWYLLSQSNKMKVLITLLVAKKTLAIQYKHLNAFDMEQYGLMLKSAYSLIAVIQTMEST